jgi:uncharacterized protein (DUF849 family)
MLQCCLNGDRAPAFHAAVPVSAAQLAREAQACREVGADEFHMHPRDAEGRETFAAAAIADALCQVRAAVPGAALGLSTRHGIMADAAGRAQAFAAWTVLPDYVSVNLSESDAPEVMDLMLRRGVGLEAGVASVADARRLIGLPQADCCRRVLIEIEQQDDSAALAEAAAITAVLDGAGLKLPRQLHGFDSTQWPLFQRARALGLDQRIGLEDGCRLADGRVARDNADMIKAAAQALRGA